MTTTSINNQLVQMPAPDRTNISNLATAANALLLTNHWEHYFFHDREASCTKKFLHALFSDAEDPYAKYKLFCTSAFVMHNYYQNRSNMRIPWRSPIEWLKPGKKQARERSFPYYSKLFEDCDLQHHHWDYLKGIDEGLLELVEDPNSKIIDFWIERILSRCYILDAVLFKRAASNLLITPAASQILN